jgi:hypothetical protein
MTNNSVVSPVMAENYNKNSTTQREVINFTLSYIRRAIDVFDVASSSTPIIADFGTSHGQNSIYAMKTIIQCLKDSHKINDEKEVLIIHNDLPTNNWTNLFESLNNDNSYHGVANGRSFYEQCLPPNSLSIGYSSSSLHWLSHKPCNLSNHCCAIPGQEKENEPFKQQSKLDFAAFLEHRSRELIIGGVLILSILCTDMEGPNLHANFAHLSYKCAQLYLSPQELLDFTYPVYFRLFEECIDNELFDKYSLKLIDVGKGRTKVPMFDQYREGHLTLDQLAKQVAAMIRSWSEFILKKSLEMNGRTEEDINKILTQIWSAHEEEIKKKPFEYDGQYFNTLLILKKIN